MKMHHKLRESFIKGEREAAKIHRGSTVTLAADTSIKGRVSRILGRGPMAAARVKWSDGRKGTHARRWLVRVDARSGKPF